MRSMIRVEESMIETDCSCCEKPIHKNDHVLHVETEEELNMICRKCLIRFLKETK